MDKELKLTAKQEAFAKEYVLNGGDASAAYRHAYNAEKMKSASVHVNASKLLKDAKVALRVEELQSKAKAKAEKKFEWSVEDRLKMLYDVAATCATTVETEEGQGKMQNPTAVISAIDQANKMTGDHAAIKQRIDAVVDGELSIPKAIGVEIVNK